MRFLIFPSLTECRPSVSVARLFHCRICHLPPPPSFQGGRNVCSADCWQRNNVPRPYSPRVLPGTFDWIGRAISASLCLDVPLAQFLGGRSIFYSHTPLSSPLLGMPFPTPEDPHRIFRSTSMRVGMCLLGIDYARGNVPPSDLWPLCLDVPLAQFLGGRSIFYRHI